MNLVVLNFVRVLVKTFYALQSNEATVEGYFDYNGLSEFVVLLFLLCITLTVVITPLVLITCWIYYSKKYVRKFRNNKDLKHSLTENSSTDYTGLANASKVEYSKTYSKMFGFGLSIIAYGISSNVYMLLTFSELREALINYFSFPFRVYRSLGFLEQISTASMPLPEVWKAMLLIVALSVAVFFIGHFIGKIIVAKRLGGKTQVI
jgi:hypothetical protein